MPVIIGRKAGRVAVAGEGAWKAWRFSDGCAGLRCLVGDGLGVSGDIGPLNPTSCNMLGKRTSEQNTFERGSNPLCCCNMPALLSSENCCARYRGSY